MTRSAPRLGWDPLSLTFKENPKPQKNLGKNLVARAPAQSAMPDFKASDEQIEEQAGEVIQQGVLQTSWAVHAPLGADQPMGSHGLPWAHGHS